MPDGLAVPLFYLIVAAIWFFIKITTSRERQAVFDWSMIGVMCFGAVGFLYEMLNGRL